MSRHHWEGAERLDEGSVRQTQCPEFILSDAVRAEILSSCALEFWWHGVPFYLPINKGCDFTYSASCSCWSSKQHIFVKVQLFSVQLLSETHHYKLSITQTCPAKLWDVVFTFKCVEWRLRFQILWLILVLEKGKKKKNTIRFLDNWQILVKNRIFCCIVCCFCHKSNAFTVAMFTLASFPAYATVAVLQNEINIAIKRLKPVIRIVIK